MIRLTVDDEASAMSTWASKTALHVGVDVIYAPRWLAPDEHLYFVNESDIAQMPVTITPERFKQLHR
jgi:hypothetical protein